MLAVPALDRPGLAGDVAQELQELGRLAEGGGRLSATRSAVGSRWGASWEVAAAIAAAALAQPARPGARARTAVLVLDVAQAIEHVAVVAQLDLDALPAAVVADLVVAELVVVVAELAPRRSTKMRSPAAVAVVAEHVTSSRPGPRSSSAAAIAAAALAVPARLGARARTAALVLDVAQALLGERCGRWRSAPATWSSLATSTRPGRRGGRFANRGGGGAGLQLGPEGGGGGELELAGDPGPPGGDRGDLDPLTGTGAAVELAGRRARVLALDRG